MSLVVYYEVHDGKREEAKQKFGSYQKFEYVKNLIVNVLSQI